MAAVPDAPLSPPTARVWVTAIAFGAIALLLNLIQLPLFTDETPSFVLGGALVLVAFVRLGTWPGIVAALLSLAPPVTRGYVPLNIAISTVIYVLQMWVAWRASRRVGSLIAGVTLYWMTLGVLLDVLLFVGLARVPAPFVALLFIKQLFNGVLDAVVAELLLRAGELLRSRSGRAPVRSLRQYLGSRIALAVAAPALMLGLLYTRSAYQTRIAGAAARAGERADRGASAVRTFMLARIDRLGRLTRQVEIRHAGRPASPEPLLTAFHDSAPEFVALAVTDARGITRAATPARSLDGVALAGRDVSSRPYFVRARATERTTVTPVLRARVNIRSRGDAEVVAVIAEPLLDGEGRFGGVLIGSLDLATLRPLLALAVADEPSLTLTLVDDDREVIASTDPARRAGDRLAVRIPRPAEPGGAVSFRFEPPGATGVAAAMHIDPREATVRAIPSLGWYLVAERPATALHREMLGAVERVVLLFVAAALLLWFIVESLTRHLVRTMGAVGGVATDIAEGRVRDAAAFAPLQRSPIAEIRQLGAGLDRMRERLSEKQALNARRVEESEARFQATFELAAVGIAHVAPDGTLLRANDRFGRIVGADPRALQGMDLERLTKPVDWLAEHPRFDQLLAGRIDRYDMDKRLIAAGGDEVWVHVTVSLVREEHGVPAYLILVAEDIAVRRALEEQLAHASKMEAVGHLAGGLAHDFNNLLTPIMGFAELAVLDLADPDAARADIEQIRAAAERARALTRQLLALGRRQLLELRVIDINDDIRRLLPMLRRLIREDIAIALELQPGLPNVRADASRIEQALVNLVINAQDAMPDGGRLTIHTARARAPAAGVPPHLLPGEYLRITVEDTGTGMTTDVARRAFEPFFTTKSRSQGSGLGLAMVYGIAEQHGGTATIGSEPGAGTRVQLWLPAVDAPADDMAGPASVRLAGGGHETILLVEDEPMVRQLACDVLERQGYRVLAARDAMEAIAIFATERDDVRLLLTDIIMPGMNGGELAARLRETSPALAVLFMTGYDDEQLRGRQTLGPHLDKPFTVAELTDAVRRVLDAAAAR